MCIRDSVYCDVDSLAKVHLQQPGLRGTIRLTSLEHLQSLLRASWLQFRLASFSISSRLLCRLEGFDRCTDFRRTLKVIVKRLVDPASVDEAVENVAQHLLSLRLAPWGALLRRQPDAPADLRFQLRDRALAAHFKVARHHLPIGQNLDGAFLQDLHLLPPQHKPAWTDARLGIAMRTEVLQERLP